MALIAGARTPAGDGLAGVSLPGLAVVQLTPERALSELRRGDVAVGRLDVRRTLDGVEEGLWALGVLEARGVTVLNNAAALLASHDKLLTARLLDAAGVPHPRTSVLRRGARPRLDPPLVVKPRFGSWGHDVLRCDDRPSLDCALELVAEREWFSRGALLQELVPPVGRDLRILVANRRCVGAVSRVAAPGEWRTNVALGARRVPVAPPREAIELAVAAAETLSAALVGVDLLPAPDGGWVVLEANGAVEFARPYATTRDVFRDTVVALAAAARTASSPGRATLDEPRQLVVG
jgi:RimK family alpha-L-glutamate ligase